MARQNKTKRVDKCTPAQRIPSGRSESYQYGFTVHSFGGEGKGVENGTWFRLSSETWIVWGWSLATFAKNGKLVEGQLNDGTVRYSLIGQRQYCTSRKQSLSLYCSPSRNWPRSFVLSIAGVRKKKRKQSQDMVGTELNERYGMYGRGRDETRTVVMQELFDEVYMREDHASTAVSLELQFVKGVTRERNQEVS
jgi:hypothetical protein